MKIVVVGGHLSPAIAIIYALPKDAQILFIGRKYVFEGDKTLSLEYKTITKQKIPFASIFTGRLQRKFTRYTIPSLFKFPYGFIQSFFILRNFKPDVVLSFGGYLSLPLGLAAFILRIPIVIHEQTLEAGIANRILSIFAKKICISWETSFKYFPRSKTVLTGNPNRHSGNQAIRRSMAEYPESLPHPNLLLKGEGGGEGGQARMTSLWNMNRELPVIYVTGGSGGSHYINTLIEACLKQLLEKFIIIHQTGDAQEYRDFDRLNSLKDSLPSKLKQRYILTRFIEPQDVGSILERVDLVVSRAGINTITELIFYKKPSLLIPLPYSQNNEQIKNALFLKSLGLGEVFYQDSLNPKKFLEILIEMFDNIDRYKILKQVQDDKGNAAQKIVEVVNYEAKVKKE